MSGLGRTVLAFVLALSLCSRGLADPGDATTAEEAERLVALVLHSLRVQLQQAQDVAYSEVTTSRGIQRRYDWLIAAFPEGDWSVHASLPTHDGATEGRLNMRVGSERLVGVHRPNGEWTAFVDDYSPEGSFRLSPTGARWFPVDTTRVDQRIAQWDPIDAEVNDDRVALVVPANTSVAAALDDPAKTIHGLFGYRFEFRRISDHYVLCRCDILVVARDRTGKQAELPAQIDDWRRDIAGYEVSRSHSRIWSDFRFVGRHPLPMRWVYRFPTGTSTGAVIPGSIQNLTPEEASERLALRVPDAWGSKGSTFDRRTGEVLTSMSGFPGVAVAESPPAPTSYTSESSAERSAVPRLSLLLVGIGVALACVALLLHFRRRPRSQS